MMEVVLTIKDCSKDIELSYTQTEFLRKIIKHIKIDDDDDKPQCADDLDSYMCLLKDPNTDNLKISRPFCHDDGQGEKLSCRVSQTNSQSTGILCSKYKSNSNAPIPLCMSWDSNAVIVGNKSTTKGNYVTACPEWDTKKKQWTCNGYFDWGNNRMPPPF